MYKACPKPRGSKKREKAEKEKIEKEREVIIELVALDEYIGRDPALQIAEFREAESKEIQTMRQLRQVNITRQKEEDRKRQLGESLDGQYCICRRGPDGFMLQCELCKEWYHGSCVPLPRTQGGKSMGKGSAALEAAKELKYLCPLCSRSRRPRLETILSLLVSLQKLPVRLPEGEALQFLTERAMNWQDRSRQFLADEDVVALLTFLSRTSASWPHGVSAENLSASAALLRLAQVGPEEEDSEKSASGDVSVTDDSGNSATAEVRPTLSEEKRRQAEQLMMEGDLLEVSLDETEQLWKALLSQKTQEEQETQVLSENVVCLSLVQDLKALKFRIFLKIDLSRVPANNGAESSSGLTKIKQMYENVHPNLALVLLFVRTEVEYGGFSFLSIHEKSASEIANTVSCYSLL